MLDLRAQRTALDRLGPADDRIYTDKGRTGHDRRRPGLCEALASWREGDTRVVGGLDRLGRSAVDHSLRVDLQQPRRSPGPAPSSRLYLPNRVAANGVLAGSASNMVSECPLG
ncbi:recombinase family protein [Rhodococcus aetherivorans]